MTGNKDGYLSSLSTRYASREMQRLFSENYKFRTWRRLWIALAKAEQRLGLEITDTQIKSLEAYRDDIDYETAGAMFQRALDAGITYFDTAYMYHGGRSETCVGDLLSAFPRDAYTLADKMPVGMPKDDADIDRVFLDQLAKTRAGHFDFYLLHAMSRDGWARARALRVVEYLERKKTEGVIRRLGFSFHDSPQALREILDALHETGDQSLSMSDLDACAGRVIAAALRLGCDSE